MVFIKKIRALRVNILYSSGAVFSYKLRYIVGFWLVEMAISTNQKPTIYRNLYENTDPGPYLRCSFTLIARWNICK